MVLSTYNFIGGANNEVTSPLNCIKPVQGDKDQGCVKNYRKTMGS